MARDTGIGEFIDVVNDVKKIGDVTEEDVFLTYTLKTAGYTFESPLVIGAILAGCDKKELDKLSAAGLALGQAFQIQDDLLDIFSTSKKIGKPILSDLNESKKTLFAHRAYTALGDGDRRILKRILEKDKKTYNDLMIFRNLVKKSEAHTYCIRKADDLISEARATLAGLGMKREYREALEELVEVVFSNTKELKELLA
jgi:geranylgeranyl diphosphate synthase type I